MVRPGTSVVAHSLHTSTAEMLFLPFLAIEAPGYCRDGVGISVGPPGTLKVLSETKAADGRPTAISLAGGPVAGEGRVVVTFRGGQPPATVTVAVV